MIEAVIWDFGGVFTTSPFEAFARYERERGIPVGAIRKINSTNHENNAWAMFERSAIDFAGFDAAFAAVTQLAASRIDDADLVAGQRLAAGDEAQRVGLAGPCPVGAPRTREIVAVDPVDERPPARRREGQPD